jgi:hypothetical protein
MGTGYYPSSHENVQLGRTALGRSNQIYRVDQHRLGWNSVGFKRKALSFPTLAGGFRTGFDLLSWCVVRA